MENKSLKKKSAGRGGSHDDDKRLWRESTVAELSRKQLDAQREDHRKDMAYQTLLRDLRRTAMLENFHGRTQEKRQRLAESQALHSNLRERWHNMERQEHSVDLALLEKAHRRRVMGDLLAGVDTRTGIAAFESNARRLGIEAGTGAMAGEDELGTTLAAANVSSLEHLHNIFSRLPDPLLLLQEGEAYKERIRARHAEESAARRERERRRRKVVMEQQKRAEAMEGERRVREREEVLQRASKAEARMAAQLEALHREKDVMRANREARERAYMDARAREFEAAVARDRETLRMMREDYMDAIRLEHERLKMERARREEAKERKKILMCQEIVMQMVGLAERAGDYRESTDLMVPRKEWREWTALFLEGTPLLAPLMPPPQDDMELLSEEDAVMNEAMLREYLTARGEWEEMDEEVRVPQNDHLVTALKEMHDTADVPNLPPLPNVSHLQLKIAVIGSPFAGKSTLATFIASAFKLHLISVEAVVSSAITAAESELAALGDVQAVEGTEDGAADVEAQPQSRLSERARLGLVAQKELLLGHQVPDTAVAQLLALAVSDLPAILPDATPVRGTSGKSSKASDGAQKKGDSGKKPAGKASPDKGASGKSSPEKGASGKASSEKGGAGKASPDRGATPGKGSGGGAGAKHDPLKDGATPAVNCEGRGFVIDGYPRTAEQAMLLTRALTGLDLDFKARHLASSSRIAPPPPPLTAEGEPFESGLDAIVVLHLEDEVEAIKRAVGRRVDPETRQIFHIQHHFPAENDRSPLAVRLRAVPAEGPETAKERVLAHADMWPALSAWLARLTHVHMLRPEEPFTALQETCTGIAVAVLDARASADSAIAAANAAETAAEAALKAAEEVERAELATKEAAKHLLAAKQAEAEALLVIKGAGDSAPARDTVIAEASASAAVHMQAAMAALADAQKALGEVCDAAQQAEEASKRASTANLGANSAKDAKEAAEGAVTRAIVASNQASAARARAEKAGGGAEATVASLRSGNSSEQPALAVSDPAPVGGPAASATSPTPLSTAAEEGKTEEPSVEPPKAVPLTNPAADELHSRWNAVERDYLDGLKRVFYNLRQRQISAVSHFVQMKVDFVAFLQRQDGKQKIVDEFQEEFNEVDAPLRYNGDMKEELASKVQQLRDQLWLVCDRRMQEAQTEREALIAAGAADQFCGSIASDIASLLRREVDRHIQTCEVLRDYYGLKYGCTIPPWPHESIISNVGAEPQPWAPVIDLKGPLFQALEPFPQIFKLLANALLSADTMLTATGATRSPEALILAPRQTAPPEPVEHHPPPKAVSGGKGKKGQAARPPSGGKKGAGGKDHHKAPPPPEEPSPEAIAAAAEAAEAAKAQVQMQAALATALRDLRSAVAQQDYIFLSLLLRIGRRAAAYSQEICGIAERAFLRLDEWLSDRFKAECKSVTEVVDLANAAVEEALPLWYALHIEGEDFHVDEEQLMLDVPPPRAREPSPPMGAMHLDTLDSLIPLLSSLAPSGYGQMVDLVPLLRQVAEETCAARNSPLNQPIIPRMPRRRDAMLDNPPPPELWSTAPEDLVKEALTGFDVNGAGLVDWRRLVVSLVDDNSRGVISSALPSQLADARKLLEAADANKDGVVTREELLSVNFWFDSELEESSFDKGAAIKNVFFSALEQPHTRGGVAIIPLLLHFVSDPEPQDAIRKAFAAVANPSRTAGEVTADELLQVIYPWGYDVARTMGTATLSPLDVQVLMRTVNETAIVDGRGDADPALSLSNNVVVLAESVVECVEVEEVMEKVMVAYVARHTCSLLANWYAATTQEEPPVEYVEEPSELTEGL